MLHHWKAVRSCAVAAGISILAAIYLPALASGIIVMPNSHCYALDKNSHLVDFTDWIGHLFEFDGEESDLVVRFCKDVESRSQLGYVDFGRFNAHSFHTGSEAIDFIQKYHNGDLLNCEHSFDKMGRNSQVNVRCGNCTSGSCKGELGCICGITYSKTRCSVHVELAIPCTEPGPRVFQGFTIGFHPRSSEVVRNGMTQFGFESVHDEFSFETEQSHVSLYLSAISSLSSLVGKPNFKVYPQRGLNVVISGSAVRGSSPTTLSPSVLNVDWQCDGAHDNPYAVDIMIPIEGYDPIQFTLTKSCGFGQVRENNPMRGWATFGVISCIFIILFSLVCCGGCIYKVRVEHQYGIDTIPGISFLSAVLDAVTRPRSGGSADSVQRVSWERASEPTQSQGSPSSRRYGSI